MQTKYWLLCFLLLFLAVIPSERERQWPTHGMFLIIAVVVVAALGFAAGRWGDVYVARLMKLRYIFIAISMVVIFLGTLSLGIPLPFGSDVMILLGAGGVAAPLIIGLLSTFGEEQDRRRELRRR